MGDNLSLDRNVYFSSLGCSKNLVDSQVMLGHLGLDGYQIQMDPEQADVIIVNTCSFIEEAKKESIREILDLSEYKESGRCKVLVVSGCMAQRYSTEIEDEIPEVDLIIGTGEYSKITQFLKAIEEGKLQQKSFVEIPKYIHTEFDPRLQTTPKHTAWLKVSEGCNRKCTFCIIPTLRGSLRSRTVESLVVEAQNLVNQGVKELNVISQDLSSYGVDLSEGKGQMLSELLDGLESVEGLHWARLFYYYPDELTDEIIQKIANSKKIAHYLDMPVQHFSSAVLRRMNRRITGEKILERVERLREKIPDIVIRTSVIVGFPGETEDDFNQLYEGIKKAKFDHLGVFKYSDEEGTPAFRLGGKVEQAIIEARFDRIYELQKGIAEENNQKWLGHEVDVLVEGFHEETDLLISSRHYGQAPEIDGQVIINDSNGHILNQGDVVKVRITDVFEYDLIAEVVSPLVSGTF